jgi:hypothetical protein
LDTRSPLVESTLPSVNATMPSVPAPMAALALPALGGSVGDAIAYSHAQVRQALREYMTTPSRLSLGERKIIIMTPKVGQKSYGNEKRFLCPHPQAILVGQAWWNGRTAAPRVNITITGETPFRDSTTTWSNIDGKEVEHHVEGAKRACYGVSAGRSLHISDANGKGKEVKAMVTVRAPFTEESAVKTSQRSRPQLNVSGGELLGVFASKEIKVISKPSKKKSNAKSSERECV